MPPTWRRITRSEELTLCLWHWLDNSAYRSSLSTNTSSSSHRRSLSQSGRKSYASRYLPSAICYVPTVCEVRGHKNRLSMNRCNSKPHSRPSSLVQLKNESDNWLAVLHCTGSHVKQ